MHSVQSNCKPLMRLPNAVDYNRFFERLLFMPSVQLQEGEHGNRSFTRFRANCIRLAIDYFAMLILRAAGGVSRLSPLVLEQRSPAQPFLLHALRCTPDDLCFAVFPTTACPVDVRSVPTLRFPSYALRHVPLHFCVVKSISILDVSVALLPLCTAFCLPLVYGGFSGHSLFRTPPK